MSVWKRVRQYSKETVTSIIHGKAWHEETKATSSQARANGSGHYLVVFTLAETDYVCDYILNGGDKAEFLEKFKGAYSAGFDPDVHLQADRRGQPDHHAARRDRGSAAPPQGGDGSRNTARPKLTSISASSTRFAARRRTGRTRWKNCCANR